MLAIGIFTILAFLGFIKRNKLQGSKQLKFTGISVAVMIVSLIAFVATSDSTDEEAEVETEEVKLKAEEPKKEVIPVVEEPKKEIVTPVEVEKPKEEPNEEKPVVKEEIVKPQEVASEWDALKENDNILGKSDKVFKELSGAKPNEVKNDTTGKWRITKIAESIPIEEYALSYADSYMKDGEVHYIVNFNYNTTTWLNKLGGLLYVEVREYVKREEHDANKLGNGMVLASYVIYPDGDIEEEK